MTSYLKSALFDFVAGILAAGFILAVCFFVENRFHNALEYLAFGLPAMVFPLAAWFRARGGSIPAAVTFLVFSLSLLLVYWLYSTAALTHISKLAAPLGITTAAILMSVLASARLIHLNRSWRGFVLALLILLPAGVVMALVPDTMGKMLTYAVIEKAPDISLNLLEGQAISIGKQRGRVVVLNFWGVWCGPCVRELPELNAAARKLENRDNVLFVAVDSSIGGETKAQVGDFARKLGLMVPVAYEANRSAYNAFRVHAQPTTVIIDPNGVIRYRRIGYAASAGYERWLSRAIEQLSMRNHRL